MVCRPRAMAWCTQEVTRANGQEQGVGVVVDGFKPAGQPGRTSLGDAVRVRQQGVEAIQQLTGSRLHILGEHRLNQNLLFGGAEGNHHVVVDVQTPGYGSPGTEIPSSGGR